MTKQKIFILICLSLLLSAVITGCSMTPRTVDNFITNYNNEIRNAMKNHYSSDKSADSATRNCSLNGYTKSFNGVNATFTGYEEPKLTLVFQFAENLSADEVFGMIDAAIMAVGDDCEEVGKALGILYNANNMNYYNVKDGYQKDITFNDKEYLIEWVGGSINFMIIILK